jgi:hypothetical protein
MNATLFSSVQTSGCKPFDRNTRVPICGLNMCVVAMRYVPAIHTLLRIELLCTLWHTAAASPLVQPQGRD